MDQIIAPGSEKILKNLGMVKKDGSRGNMIVRFIIDFPTYLSDEQKEGVKRYLP